MPFIGPPICTRTEMKFRAQTNGCEKRCRRGGASEPLKLAGSLQGTLGLLLPLQTQQFKTYVISVRFAPQFLEGRGRSKPLPYDISISFQFQTPIWRGVIYSSYVNYVKTALKNHIDVVFSSKWWYNTTIY